MNTRYLIICAARVADARQRARGDGYPGIARWPFIMCDGGLLDDRRRGPAGQLQGDELICTGTDCHQRQGCPDLDKRCNIEVTT